MTENPQPNLLARLEKAKRIMREGSLDDFLILRPTLLFEDAIAEIERLRALVKAGFRKGYHRTRSGIFEDAWDDSFAKHELEGK